MKRLYKNRENKMFLGVCGGVSEYLDVDPSVIRIVWFILAFTGVGLLAYFVAAFILPFKDEIV